MPVPPPNGTYSVPELGIGNSESQIQNALFVGNSFLGRTVAWEVPDPADCASTLPANFTDYTPVAEILDATGAVVETLTVTPAVGDITGVFTVELSSAQTTAALAAAGKQWRFDITSAAPSRDTLIIAPFQLRTV